MDTINFTISYRGQAFPLSLLPSTTLDLLQARLEELTSVPSSNQKLLFKGKKMTSTGSDTLTQVGIKEGLKVQLLGSTAQEVGELRHVEDEIHRKERIMRERASKPQAKLRSTSSASTSSIQFRFHRIEPLAHLPNPSAASAVLHKLADDPAVHHIMQLHQFAVGLLTELAPHEQPHLLGLNENGGQVIKLRIRTDAYDGFRTYKEIRRVLCHELTHNVHGDHDNNFKELNSKLNREVAEFERAKAQGTHHLHEFGGSMYEPSSELEAEAQAHVLGLRTLGGSTVSLSADSPEERRRRVLDATMRRLQKEEEELEQSCGTAGPSSSS